MTLTALLALIGLAIAGIFKVLRETFKSGENKIKNEQNENQIGQLEKELEEIADSERTDTYIDSLSNDDIARKLRAFEEANKRDEAAKS